MTQLEAARKGIVTEAMQEAARYEGMAAEQIRERVADGTAVIPANINHTNRFYHAIGKGLRVKINANIGTSPSNTDIESEIQKLSMVEDLGAESVMDLSIAGDLDLIRSTLIQRSRIMVGTVPIYQILTEMKNCIDRIDADAILSTIEKHGSQGVDFVTVHCGLTRDALPLIEKRVMGVVSRGGSFIARWMRHHGQENPLYTRFDDILDIARKYDITLSLGDGLRPGALADATDDAQLHELRILGELTTRARRAGVQVMVEGPGHVPFNQIERNMRLQSEICDGAPFYVLGPLTTDRAPGYDHIVSAIGATMAAFHGAAFICYVTPAEHLRLPTVDDVREGVIAAKIAAHSADIALGNAAAIKENLEFSRMRHEFDWQGMFDHAIDPGKPARYRRESTHNDTQECSMCGDFCALKMLEEEKK